MIIYIVLFIMSFLSSSGDVREAINKSIRDLFYLEPDGTAHPYVCLVCDSFTGSIFVLHESSDAREQQRVFRSKQQKFKFKS